MNTGEWPQAQPSHNTFSIYSLKSTRIGAQENANQEKEYGETLGPISYHHSTQYTYMQNSIRKVVELHTFPIPGIIPITRVMEPIRATARVCFKKSLKSNFALIIFFCRSSASSCRI